jgi:FAD/FMN-containing dehydrogenase
VLRLSCLPAELPAALADLRAAAGQGVALAICARALSGVAYVRLRGPVGALSAAHAALIGRWPHIAVIGAPPALAAELPVWGRELPNLALMQRIKQEFDPAGLLNPGRYVDH